MAKTEFIWTDELVAEYLRLITSVDGREYWAAEIEKFKKSKEKEKTIVTSVGYNHKSDDKDVITIETKPFRWYAYDYPFPTQKIWDAIEKILSKEQKPKSEQKPSRDWEIVEIITPFFGSNDVIFSRGNDGVFRTGLNGKTFEYSESNLLSKPAAKIKAVKRSDGEVFSVGDEVETRSWGIVRIEKFDYNPAYGEENVIWMYWGGKSTGTMTSAKDYGELNYIKKAHVCSETFRINPTQSGEFVTLEECERRERRAFHGARFGMSQRNPLSDSGVHYENFDHYKKENP